MSTTDQAFMRAYRDPAVAALRAAPERPQPAEPDQPIAPIPNSNVIEIGGSSAEITTFCTIHVGLNPAVPAPHVAFTELANTASELHPIQSSSSPPVGVRPPPPPPSSARISKAIGHLPKASLSSFTASRKVAKELPRAALEVDALRWPAVCQSLLAKQIEAFDRLIDQLRADCLEGCKVIGITGSSRSEGRTTLAMCLARRWAAAAGRVALIDADFRSPGLFKQLGLAIEHGWEATIEGHASAWESMIESKTDRLSILPLSHPVAPTAVAQSSFRIAGVLQELSEHFDLVVVDAGPISGESSNLQWIDQTRCGVDGWIVVRDVRRNDATGLVAASLRLAELNHLQLGIAETFVDS